MLADSILIPEQIDRSNGDVLAGVQDALWEADGLRSLNYKNIEAEARAGEVFLRGHVRSVMHKHEAEQRVVAVRGVEVVHNELVADSDLEIAVAQALAVNQPTSMRDVNARPRFREADFPMPPADWQLPFPYHAGEVHWSA